MGHDIHFLRRLERLTIPHVDTAMALYRDRELLGAVLDLSPLPADAERVAISLADPITGPFILVERSGQFVTCSPGMVMFTSAVLLAIAEGSSHSRAEIGKLLDSPLRYATPLHVPKDLGIRRQRLLRTVPGPVVGELAFTTFSAFGPIVDRCSCIS